VKTSALLGMVAGRAGALLLPSPGEHNTLIVSVSIPVSIIATFVMMYFGGLTLNVMTLSGLALGAGDAD